MRLSWWLRPQTLRRHVDPQRFVGSRVGVERPFVEVNVGAAQAAHCSSCGSGGENRIRSEAMLREWASASKVSCTLVFQRSNHTTALGSVRGCCSSGRTPRTKSCTTGGARTAVACRRARPTRRGHWSACTAAASRWAVNSAASARSFRCKSRSVPVA